MGTIKPLPKSVRNSVRAGVILYDVTKVVEELVYNSLDAGASKVSSLIVLCMILCYVEARGCLLAQVGNVIGDMFYD